MKKHFFVSLLTASIALAQTIAQTAPKPTKPGSVTGKTGGTPPAAPKSVAEPLRPLPQPSLRTKLRSNNTANPNYAVEKVRGRGI